MIVGRVPADGETKKYRTFALWPTKCSDRTIRWLETLEVTEKYHWYETCGHWSKSKIMPLPAKENTKCPAAPSY